MPLLLGDMEQILNVKDKQKVHQYYSTNGLIRLQVEEPGQAEIIKQIVKLQNFFPDIKIDTL